MERGSDLHQNRTLEGYHGTSGEAPLSIAMERGRG